jgi:FkbM family methyltransferase
MFFGLGYKARMAVKNLILSDRIDTEIPTEVLGGPGYGEYTMSTEGLGASSVVYSFGIGEDASWDKALIERFGCQVYAFDPTPRSIAYVKNMPEKFVFQPIGVAGYDGGATFFPPAKPGHVSHTLRHFSYTEDKSFKVPVKKLPTIMKELGHTHIDILKIDIEGAEYEVIKDMLAAKIYPKQILVDFDRWMRSTYQLFEIPSIVKNLRGGVQSVLNKRTRLFFHPQTIV